MRNLTLAVAVMMALVFSVNAFAQEAPAGFILDKAHTQITFKAKHLGISWINGNFKQFELEMNYDTVNPENSTLVATINVSSISTDNETRDKHLLSPDFFDAEKFPMATFVSKKIILNEDNSFQLIGDLTIRDVTKEVTLNGNFYGSAIDPWGMEHLAASASTEIKRKEFGLSWNVAIESGALVAGDEVTINIYIEILRPVAPKP